MANFNLKPPPYITYIFHYDKLVELYLFSRNRYKRNYYKKMAKLNCSEYNEKDFPRLNKKNNISIRRNNMLKIILNSLMGGYFGFALSTFCSIDFNNWKFYATSIPVIFGFIAINNLIKN